MTPISCLRGGLCGPALGQRLVLAALLAWAGWAGCSNAQAQPCCPPDGSAPVLPPMHLHPPQPTAGFIDDKLSANDAAFEVFVGQGRILTLKEDLDVTNAPYSTGTIAYTQATRTVTLTGGTWPSWAQYGVLVIGNVLYRVAAKPTSTTLVLTAMSNPGVDVPAGAMFTLIKGKQRPLIAVGDPGVIEFYLVNLRQIRVRGLAIGVTDLSITTADGETYSFEVRVTADLDVLRAKLRCLFPDASIKLSQLREHIVVEGEARDAVQVAKIIETTKLYLRSIQTTVSEQNALQPPPPPEAPGGAPSGAPRTTTTETTTTTDKQPDATKTTVKVTTDAPEAGPQATGNSAHAPGVALDRSAGPQTTGNSITQNFVGNAASSLKVPPIEVINLLHVPGPQQVLLKVRVAELNRTGLRQIGGDFLSIDPSTGAIVGTQIGGAAVSAAATAASRLTGSAATAVSPQTTLFGIFQEGDFAVFLSALRRNSLLKLLAEPNLVALNGQQASFLAGGQFPVPISQPGSSGAAPTVTVEFHDFGVKLAFVPFILDDDTIRLTVDPEVSTIDPSISGTVLVPGGTPVPALSIRKAHTVVELHQGQTLAIAGLMQLSLDGNTSRIPGLGDLPIIGPFFSNTTSSRMEKELIVLVTPYLVEPMNPGQVPPVPGDEVNEPNDLEFYLLNRIQGRTGRDFRDTIEYDDALHVVRCLLKLEKDHVRGPFGFCD
jgi:pilus assembly protein CpaC